MLLVFLFSCAFGLGSWFGVRCFCVSDTYLDFGSSSTPYKIGTLTKLPSVGAVWNNNSPHLVCMFCVGPAVSKLALLGLDTPISVTSVILACDMEFRDFSFGVGDLAPPVAIQNLQKSWAMFLSSPPHSVKVGYSGIGSLHYSVSDSLLLANPHTGFHYLPHP